MISEFKERFSNSSKIAMRMVQLLPGNCCDNDAVSDAMDAFKEYRTFLDSLPECKPLYPQTPQHLPGDSSDYMYGGKDFQLASSTEDSPPIDNGPGETEWLSSFSRA